MPNDFSVIHILKSRSGVEYPSIEGRTFCSKYDPEKEASDWWAGIKGHMDSQFPVVVLGLGAGFHLSVILADSNAPKSVYAIDFREELVNHWKVQNVDRASKVVFLNAHSDLSFIASAFPQVVFFRPAFSGLEAEFEEIHRKLIGENIKQSLASIRNDDYSHQAKMLRLLGEFIK